MKPRLLILTASTGNGHLSAANAIAAEARLRGLYAEPVDVLDHVSPGFRTWYRGGYEQLVRNAPQAWGHLYKSSDRPLFNYQFQTGLDWSFCRRLSKLIYETRPDWVVCTHSLPQPRLATVRKRLPFRMAIVVTDLYVHRMWLRGRPDHFFLPQPWSKEVLQMRRPSFARKCDVTGIPVHPEFTKEHERESSRQLMELPDSPLALVSSGGIGGGPLATAVESLRSSGIAVAVVAGRNESLATELRGRFQGDEAVRVFGHVGAPEMAKLMSACDVIVGKPGGLTTFEALATGLPFVVYWPFLIPGQEEGNAEFLEQVGAGIIVRDEDDVGKRVTSLLSESGRLVNMARIARAHGQPQAARLIVDRLCEL